MSNNNELVFKGFRHLLKAFAPYICALLKIEYGADWWCVAVMGKLWDEQKRDLPEDGPEQMLVSSLDIQRCLILFDLHWSEVFRKRFPSTIAHGPRNSWASATSWPTSARRISTTATRGVHWIPCPASASR